MIDQDKFKAKTLVDHNGCWIWQRALKGGKYRYGCALPTTASLEP